MMLKNTFKSLIAIFCVCLNSSIFASVPKNGNEDLLFQKADIKVSGPWKIFLNKLLYKYLKDKYLAATLYESLDGKHQIMMFSENKNEKIFVSALFEWGPDAETGVITENLSKYNSIDKNIEYKNNNYKMVEQIILMN